jgi:hypothetical protein
MSNIIKDQELSDSPIVISRKSKELAEPASCPIATQDVKTNLANRQTAVDDANYGPANPNEPNEDYWKAKADEFQGDLVTAKKMLCGNCAAFDQRSKILGCIKKGIGEDANEVAVGGDLGYCEIFDFKCAAKRTCDAWIVGGPITDKKQELARPVSQTPAPPKERIKGSKENPKGTASTRSKAGDIEISEQNEEALKNKIAEFKDKHPSRKAPSLGALKKVFRRGAGAFSTSFRPTISGGRPNSRNAWAMARVNKFLKMAGGGEVKDSYRKADGDLLEERFDCGTGAGGFKEGNTCAGGGGGESFNDIGATWRNSENTQKAKQKFDALPDDAIVTVYHGTTKENAESLIKANKVSVPSGYKSDLPTMGRDSLYIAPTIADAKKYGDEIVEIKIRKKDMFPSQEAKEINPKVSIGKAFFNSFDGAVLNRGQSFEGIKRIDNKQ